MKKVLVTGGGGFVGLAIVKRLVSEHIEVMVVGRHRYPEVERLGVATKVGDIRDGQFLVRAARGLLIETTVPSSRPESTASNTIPCALTGTML